MKGLIIKQPWIDYILNGQKTWEIRGRNTKTRGEVQLIQSGSGYILGEATLVDCILLSEERYFSSVEQHQIIHDGIMPYQKTYAWVFETPVRYEQPIPYQHPQGAVIWVKLKNE